MNTDVRHQPHYDHGIQPIDYMRSRFTTEELRGFLTGNILKYVSRFSRKDGVRDLEKARVYLDWLIDAEKPSAADAPTNDYDRLRAEAWHGR